jgi:fermentation-respiration switch protein FrsA (DUF1100 family)
VARIAPRPVLFVNASSDATISKEATERLFAAANEPKSIEWFDASHDNLPGVALKRMWQFLKDNLELS